MSTVKALASSNVPVLMNIVVAVCFGTLVVLFTSSIVPCKLFEITRARVAEITKNLNCTKTSQKQL